MSIFKNIVAAGLSVAILATPMVSSFRTNADAETPETTISETTTSETSETTTEVSETTTEPSETTAEQTAATTSAPVQTAGDADAYIDEVSELSDSYRLIVSADTDTSALAGATGVAYDGSCILTFTSEADYNAAIAYFDTNAISYATDGEVSLCGDGSEDVPTGTVSDNAAVKIAIIDTGSNVANESVSVLGDSLTDGNGHGTAMANYVLAQTDNAYILSVKAIGDNGTGSVTDVYAGVQYAIDADCDVILLAMSIPDSGNYDTFKSLIGQAEADGITVIASAGNNSADASAYLPAGIDGVTTVGALNPDGTKLGISNYGSCVDYYVPAGSTSEAAATFAGKFIAGNIADVATGYAESTPAVTAAPTPTSVPAADTDSPDLDDSFIVNLGGQSFTATAYTNVDNTASATNNSSAIKTLIKAALGDYGVTAAVERDGAVTGIGSGYGISRYKITITVSDGENGRNFLRAMLGSDANLGSDNKGLYHCTGNDTYSIKGKQLAIDLNDKIIADLNTAGSEVPYVTHSYGGHNWVCGGCTGFTIGDRHVYCIDPSHTAGSNDSTGEWKTVDKTAYENVFGAGAWLFTAMHCQAVDSGIIDARAMQYYAYQLLLAGKGKYDQLNIGLSNGDLDKYVDSVCTPKGRTSMPEVNSIDPRFPQDAPYWINSGSPFALSMTEDGQTVSAGQRVLVLPGHTYTFVNSTLASSEAAMVNALDGCAVSCSYDKMHASVSNGTGELTISVDSDADPEQIATASVTVEGGTHDCGALHYNTANVEIFVSSNNQTWVRGSYSLVQDKYNVAPWSIGFYSSIDVSFIKTSTCPAVIGNSLYSLAGTTYGIYGSADNANSDTSRLATITSDANGHCTVDGKAAYTTTHTNATLYLKELTAGAGYKLNPDVISVQLGGSNQTVTLKDEPITDPLNWTLQKTDANKYNIATGLTLAGAVFEVDYYDTVSVNSVEDAQALSNPKATVQLTTATNAAGSASIALSGSILRTKSAYFASLGILAELPLGTYIIREVSAPAGYTSVPSTSPFVIKLFEDANGEVQRNYLSTSNQFYATLDSENAVIYEQPKTGVVAVTKTVTSDNGLETVAPSLYDLAGTTYDLRVADGEKGAGNLYCTVTFGTDGRISNVAYAPGLTVSEADKWKAGDTAITVPYTSETSGKYYFVETHSARGFYLDEAKHDVTVTPANTKESPAEVTLSDEPMMTSFGTFYKHIVSGTIAAADSEDVCRLFPKNGVSFMISYYNGIYETAAELPARPNAGWTVTSDGNGEFSATNTYLDDATRSYINAGLLSGVLTDRNDTAAAPQGTYVISEIRVSDAMAACGITVNTDKVIVPVRFAADIVKGSEADPANSSVAEINTAILGIVGETKSPFINLYNPTVESNAVNAATNQTVITGITVARSPDCF